MSLFDDGQIDVGGAGCYMCRRWRQCKNPKIKPIGNMKKGLLFLLEAPSQGQDAKGRIDTGTAYDLLKKTLAELDIDILEDCRIMFSVCCYGRSKEITENYIDLCRSNVWTEIKKVQPKAVFVLGKSALLSIIGRTWKRDRGEFSSWEGLSIPDKNLNTWILPIYSPRDFLKDDQYKDISKEAEWVRQIRKGILLSKKKIPADTGLLPNTEILHGPNRLSYLKSLLSNKPKYLAFDYETNCLKPQLKGAKIYTVSFATNSETGVAMPFDDEIIPLVRKVFTDRSIKKIASNMKFEDAWTNVILGVPVRGWWHDTMLCAHIEDNRSLYSGLKKQVFIHFGVPDYSEAADRYLHSDSLKKLNKIHEMNETDLLQYNALDSVFEYKLAMKQRKVFI